MRFGNPSFQACWGLLAGVLGPLNFFVEASRDRISIATNPTTRPSTAAGLPHLTAASAHRLRHIFLGGQVGATVRDGPTGYPLAQAWLVVPSGRMPPYMASWTSEDPGLDLLSPRLTQGKGRGMSRGWGNGWRGSGAGLRKGIHARVTVEVV